MLLIFFFLFRRVLFVPLFIVDTYTPRDKIGKKNYERKRKREKARGDRREIDTWCQSMSKGEMYKKYFSSFYQYDGKVAFCCFASFYTVDTVYVPQSYDKIIFPLIINLSTTTF